MKKTLQNTNVKAVVLDMDGLMIDTEPIYKRAMQNSAKELGFPLTDEFMIRLVGRPDSECREIILDQFGTEFPMGAFWERWPQLWRDDASVNGIDRKPGLTELLSYFAEAEIPTAIATSTYREQAEFSLKAANVTYSFSHIVTGEEVDRGKPAPDIYLEAARRLGIEPKYCVALEDSENGIQSASSAGMIAIMIPDLIPPSKEIRAAASCVLNSLYEALALIAGTQATPKSKQG